MSNMCEDVNAKIISLTEANEILKSFEGKWVYVKSCMTKLEGEDQRDYYSNYNKLRVSSVFFDEQLHIYGIEDEDKLTFDLSDIKQVEKRENEVIFKLVNEHVCTYIYIYTCMPNKQRLIDELLTSNKNMVITEGKTDWKHLKAALKYFNKKNEYNNLDFRFLEYENSMSERKNLSGNKTLQAICEYVSLFKNNSLRIFVFDADDEVINKEYGDEKGYKYLGNNVYVIILPVPDFRKDTPLISIENYYTDDEIKTKDVNGKRLYLSNEFSKNEIDNGDVITLKYDKKRPNLVIDHEVYNIDKSIKIREKKDIKENKKLLKTAPILSKNDFAEKILNEIPPFDSISKENFRLFFDILELILKKQLDNELKLEKEETLSHNTTIKVFSTHYEMNINVSMKKDDIKKFKENKIKYAFTERKDGCICIFFGYSIQKCGVIAKLPLSEVLDKFIEYKSRQPQDNRIYVHVYDEKEKYNFSYEILKGDDWNMSRVQQ